MGLPLYQSVMETIGKPVVFNICVLGALIGFNPLVKIESILKILEQRFPAAFLGINRQALESGYTLGSAMAA